jgi:hypothetical protein
MLLTRLRQYVCNYVSEEYSASIFMAKELLMWILKLRSEDGINMFLENVERNLLTYKA